MMIKKSLIKQAVKVLQDLNEKFYEDSSKKKPLLENEKEIAVYLQVTLKKIPNRESIKMIKVRLPHPLLKDSNEVCLITGDLDKKNHKAEIEPDILHYKQLLEKHDITQISEVMTLRQLRTDYKPFEAKQKLLAAYDVFLADSKIVECLPRVLGKHFFRKRKFPLQIDMKNSNLKKQIEKALATKVFYITGHGNSCSSEVAYLDMDDLEIIDNIMAVANNLSDQLPGSWSNVMGVYLKTSKSKAIPLYVSYDGSSDVKMNDEKHIDTIEDDLSTIPNVSVRVYSDGTVMTKRLRQDKEVKIKGNDEIENTEHVNSPELVKSSQKFKKAKKKITEMESKVTISNDFQDSEHENSPELVKSSKKFKKAKKGSTEIESILQIPNDFQDSKLINSEKSGRVSEKLKKSKKRTEIEIFPVSNDLDEETAQNSKKSKRTKRKRFESESTLKDNADSKSETPVQVIKKRKLDELNMKKYNAMKESRRNKRKKRNNLG